MSAGGIGAAIAEQVAQAVADVTGRRMIVHALDDEGVVVEEPLTGDVHDEPYAYLIPGPGRPGDAVFVGEVGGKGALRSRTRVVHGVLVAGPRPTLLPGETFEDVVSTSTAEEASNASTASWKVARRLSVTGLDPDGTYDVVVGASGLFRVDDDGASCAVRARLVGAATWDGDPVDLGLSVISPATTRLDCSDRFAARAPRPDGSFEALLQFKPNDATTMQARNPSVRVAVRRLA